MVLRADLACDAERFVALAESGRIQEALDLYHGPFCDSFALPGARSFEDWAAAERARLHGILVRTTDLAAQRALDEGRAKTACALARRLVEADPRRERSWRILLESRLADQDVAGAAVDAAGMLSALESTEATVEPATLDLLRRVQRRPAARGPDATTRFEADLVGRAQVFARLTDAWQRATTVGRTTVTLSGDAGLGKTRLLGDFSARLRALGARVIGVTAPIANRDLPYALLADLAERLSALPGSLGIGAAWADTLVALEPRLQARFPTAAPSRVHPDDLTRRRADAIAELLGAACDERPIALLLDDMHWADEASRRAIASALTRLGGSRLLVVWATRGAATLEGLTLSLGTLRPEDVADLLSSIATLPPEPWAARLPAAVHRASGGIPLLVLEALAGLDQEGRLRIVDQAWQCGDATALFARLDRLDVRRERVARLDAAMRRALLLLVVAGGTVSDALWEAALGPSEAAAVTARLLAGAWVTPGLAGIALRHDDIGATVLDAATPDVLRDARQRILACLDAMPGPTPAESRRMALLALELGDAGALLRAIGRRRADHDLPAAERGSRRAAEWLLGERLTPEAWARIATGLPWWADPRLRHAAAIVAAVGAVGVVAATGWAARRAEAPRALRFAVAPLAGNDLALVPAPVVEVVNATGQRVIGARVPVRLSIRDSAWGLEGPATVVAESGRAVFTGVRLRRPPHAHSVPSLRVLATSEGLTPTASALLDTLDLSLFIDTVVVVGASARRTASRTFRVAPDVPLRLDVALRYTAPWPAAAVMLAGVPTWGDPSRSYLELGPMSTPARDAVRHAAVELRTPARPGRHRIFFVMYAESDAAHIASATNWEVGAPRWNDGNDIAGWGDEEVAHLERTGRTSVRGGYVMRNGQVPLVVGAAAIELEVGAPRRE